MSTEKRIVLTWIFLLLLSYFSYVTMDRRGTVVLLFSLLFVKLERIWTVYLAIDRGPRWLHLVIISLSLILSVTLALIAR